MSLRRVVLTEEDNAIIEMGRALFPSKGDKLRFKVMKALLLGPHTQAELYEMLRTENGITRQAIHKACATLKRAGLIEEVGGGSKRKEYRISVLGKKLLGFLYELQRERKAMEVTGEGEV